MKSIRSRVRLILILSLVSMIVLIGFSTYFFNEQSKMSEESRNVHNALTDSEDIKYQMTATTQKQMAFFNQPSKETAEGMKKSISRLKESAGSYAEDYSNYPKISTEFTNIQKSASEYEKELKPLVNMFKIVGFSSNEGMYKFIKESYNGLNQVIASQSNPALKNALLNMKVNELAFVNSPDQETLSAFENSADEFQSTVQSLDITSDQSDTLNQNLLKYEQTINSINSTFEQASGIRKAFEDISSTVSNQVNQVSASAQSINADIEAEQSQLKSLMMLLLAIIGGIALLVTFVTGFILIRSISKSIKTLKEGATIIGEGNLSHRIKLTSKDEMAELGAQFNQMASKMEQSVRKVLQASGVLNSSSDQLAYVSDQTTTQAQEVNEAINQVAIGSQSQAQKIEESTQLIENVSDAIQNTKQATNGIGASLNNAEREGKEGLNTVTDLENTSNSFIELASHMSTEVQSATQQSQQVNTIVATIEDIADSTDLLALNAAIESARAGDAGRGFAVVADEVRKLAERSKVEARSIHELVNNMSAQMTNLSSEAEKFDHYQRSQNEAVSHTKEAFNRISSHVKDMNIQIRTVTEAVNGVEQVNEEVKHKLHDISIISEEAVATAEEVAASSENQLQSIDQVNHSASDLQGLSQELTAEVSQFTISEEELYTDEDETGKDIETADQEENREEDPDQEEGVTNIDNPEELDSQYDRLSS